MTDSPMDLPISIAEVVDASENKATDIDRLLWERKVRHHFRDRCGNCGTEVRLKVRMVIPLDAGGQLRVSNGTLLCRACEMAREASSHRKGESKSRPINFHVSKDLNDRMEHGIETYNGFHSKAGLVRALMTRYVEENSRFDDLELFQDDASPGSAKVKINIWAPNELYEDFKALADTRGFTVTATLKSLIIMYEAQVEPLVRRRKD